MIDKKEFPYIYVEDFLNKSKNKIQFSLENKEFASLFVNNYFHPLIYFIAMELSYDEEWLDFEPEVIRRIFSDFPDKIDDIINFHYAWSILSDEGLNVDWNILLKIIESFSLNFVDYNWLTLPEIEEVCDALSTIHSVFNTELDYENKNLIIAICKANDFEVLRPEYKEIEEHLDLNEKLTWFYYNDDNIDEDLKKMNSLIDNYKKKKSELVKDFLFFIM